MSNTQFWVVTHHQHREFLCFSDIILQGIQQGWCCKNYVGCFLRLNTFKIQNLKDLYLNMSI